MLEIFASLDEPEEEAVAHAARVAGYQPSAVRVSVVRRSLDARKGHPIGYWLEVAIWPAEAPPQDDVEEGLPPPLRVRAGAHVVVVGTGPCGTYAALRLTDAGVRVTLVDIGKPVQPRRHDLASLTQRGALDPASNYCFGEGGAGTFSDGKLYTRATKRGPVAKVYEVLVAHGAPQKILTDAHPHIGSNLLPNVVKAMRGSILAGGGEVRFQSKVVDFLMSGNRVQGVVTSAGEEIPADAVILATGHSARDIYALLAAKKILMEQKPFAVGFRIEHPQPFIDRIQYHLGKNEDRPRLLPAARYRLATKIRDRGVHSFCMCPGGWIVPAATENDEVVVNGMSLARRDSPFANSGMVVTVEPEDVKRFEKEHGILAGIAYQKEMERTAKTAGGGGQIAPGQRVADFLAGKISADLPEMSYFPGANCAPLHDLLPPGIYGRMREGLRLFGRQIRGYDSREGLLLGFETRTSSPLRVPRRDDTLEHPEIEGLFPCGEGAGYAGGIVSAALDGMRVAEAVVR